MPQNETGAGSRCKEPARHDQHPAKSTEPLSRATVTRGVASAVNPTTYRELGGWIAAAEHLNARVPAYAASAFLRLVP